MRMRSVPCEESVVLYDIPPNAADAIRAALNDPEVRYDAESWSLTTPRLMEHVCWTSYKAVLHALSEMRLRHTYDRGRLEVFPCVSRQERLAAFLARFVGVLSYELDIPIQSMGCTTLWRTAKSVDWSPTVVS